MRTYLHLFFRLLMPVSMIITIVSIAYFSLNYDFTKAMKLGVISGVLIGLCISFIMALLQLVIRRGQKTIQEPVHIHKNTDNNIKDIPVATQNSSEQKLMLLMDKKLAAEVSLHAITEQKIGDITTNDTNESFVIIVQSPEENIHITITSLTKHTSQIVLKSARNSQHITKIISYIKEKEDSFLQY